MAKVLSVVSGKGGTGKSTISLNYGYTLVRKGKKVLLIDGDSQQSLTSALKFTHRAKSGLTQMVMTGSAEGCITKTDTQNLHLVYNDDPQGEHVGLIPNFLQRSASNHSLFSLACESISDEYDHIIVDTMGAHSTFQESAIYAADHLISPVSPDYLDTTELLQGLIPRLGQLLPVRPGLPTLSGKDFPPLFVVINKVRKNVRDQEEACHWMYCEFQSVIERQYPRLKTTVLKTLIYNRANFNKALGRGLSAQEIEVSSSSSPSIKEMMDSLVKELDDPCQSTSIVTQQRVVGA